MTDFAYGFLVRAEHHNAATEAANPLTTPHIFRALNKAWSVLLIDDWPDEAPAEDWLIEHSKAFPVLFYHHEPDGGWGYEVHDKGEITAALEVNYQLSWEVTASLAAWLYPEQDIYESEAIRAAWKSIAYVVDGSDKLTGEIEAQYIDANPAAFEAFGLDEKTVARLEQLLTPAGYPRPRSDVPLHGQVTEFKAALNIGAMTGLNLEKALRG
ncbi:MAG: hypothetical protein AAF125_15725 [Chloroflexota bacterium]